MTVRPDAVALDEFMLVRDGLLPLDAVDLPTLAGGDEIVDLEGAVVAVHDGHELRWHTDDSRPFAQLYATADRLAQVHGRTAVWVDHRDDDLTESPQHAVLLVPTGPSHLLNHRAAGRLQSALSMAQQRPDLTVLAVPVDLDTHPQRRAQIEQRIGVNTVAREPNSTASPAGVFYLLTGFSGSGKSTIARALREELLGRGATVTLLDGDIVRRELSAGLGFSPADRDTNVRRIGWVGAEIAAHGGTVIACPIAPYDATRKQVRALVEEAGAQMVLVHVATSIEECERRDRKGLYAKARAGEVADFTGISAPYEVPDDAEVVIDTSQVPVNEAVRRILAHTESD